MLIDNIDEKTKSNAQSFFKEKINYHGVKVSVVTALSKEIFKSISGKSKHDIFEICEGLWKSGFSEETYIACNLSYYIHDRYEREDFTLFQNWLDTYVDNWANCDTLCNHTIGTFIEMYPEFISELKNWTASENRWVRRGAAVTLIIPARKGLFLPDIFEIADKLLTDGDDLVQKGYGWMLKAASEAHREEVFDYVMFHKQTMPRTSLRYAIEKMPPEWKARAMAK